MRLSFRSPFADAWLRNNRGSAALEFALVAVPFFMLLFGIIIIGLYFFTSHALENGVESAARKIRTGEAQKGDVTVSAFKQLVCSEAGSYIDCNKLRVVLQSAEKWGDITPQPCVNGEGQVAASTGADADKISMYTGAASQVVLVTLCYQWDLAQSFSFLNLGANPDGTGPAIIPAAVAFRTEPYT
jgi:Flp pilus assembly protein TadG